MSVGPSSSIDAARREAAATWLVRLQADDTSEADWLAFERWLADPANKAAMAVVENVIGEVDDHAAEIAAALKSPPRSGRVIPLRPKGGTRLVRTIWGGAIAAALAAAAALLVVPNLIPPAAKELAYSAPTDAPLSITLPDNSTAELNRGAEIKVRWTKTERRVVLSRGEAAFKVKHIPAQPFVVAAGEETIRDIGTEFNVLRRTDSVAVTVKEGVVNVAGPGIAPVDVTAGHSLVVNHAKRQAILSQVNPDDAFAWQQGRLVYHDATLAMIVADLNRYGATQIRLADATVGQLRFSGVLMIQPSGKMVSQLEAFLPVRSDENKGEIVIRSR